MWCQNDDVCVSAIDFEMRRSCIRMHETHASFELMEGLFQKRPVPFLIKLFLSNVLNCVCSLVPGWPQEGDLSHRQQGAVLRPSRDTFGVSYLTLVAWRHRFISKTDVIFLCYCSRHDRKKPLLFYFNILKCASPLVLLEFQCPTTQVRLPLITNGSSVWSMI